MRVRLMLVPVTVLLAAVTACGGGSGTAGSAGAVSPAAAPSPAPSEPPGGTTVRLLEPGAEPRETLRLAVTPGAQTRTTMSIRTGIKLRVDGRSAGSLPAVPVTTDVVMKAGTVAPNGDVDGSYTMEHFRVDGPAGRSRDAAQQGAQQFDGLTGTFTVNARGETIRSDLTPPPGLDPALAGTLDGVSSQIATLSVPFPAEPVGVGARWTASVGAKVNGIATTADFTYTLRQRSGSDYVIDATYRQGGPPQKNVALTGLPAGAAADVDSIDIAGTSTTNGSLTELLPGTATVKSDGSIALTVHNGQQSGALREALDIAVELRKAS